MSLALRENPKGELLCAKIENFNGTEMMIDKKTPLQIRFYRSGFILYSERNANGLLVPLIKITWAYKARRHGTVLFNRPCFKEITSCG